MLIVLYCLGTAVMTSVPHLRQWALKHFLDNQLVHLQVRSGVMLLARDKWKQLKVAQLGPLFEVADIADQQERTAKRARR